MEFRIALGTAVVGVAALAAYMVYRSTSDTQEDFQMKLPANPQSIADFDYQIDSDGVLRNSSTGEPFKFVDQRHYVALGEQLEKDLVQKMVADFKLKKLYLPFGAKSDEPRIPIYHTENLAASDKILVIVQSCGGRRPETVGLWSRSTCIQVDIHTGTIFSYLKEAEQRDYAVIVLNPNANKVKINGQDVPVPENETPTKHLLYVWDNLLSKTKAKHIFFIAHSLGGPVLIELLKARPDSLDRITSCAFACSVHTISPEDKQDVKFLNFIQLRTRNWVKSLNAIDTPINDHYTVSAGCPCVSSGQHKQDLVPPSIMESVFKFFDDLRPYQRHIS